MEEEAARAAREREEAEERMRQEEEKKVRGMCQLFKSQSRCTRASLDRSAVDDRWTDGLGQISLE